MTSKNIPLSLYIHIPWCEKKCPYCDFNSHNITAALPEKQYIDALLADFRLDLNRFADAIQERSISSIFIGGGTPSLFSAASFDYLLSQLKQLINFSDDIEITLEANPGSSEVDKFTGFRQASINRLSIGIQSFNSTHLVSLGRVHSSNEAIQAANYAKQAGFNNFNLDLMFGLPKQTLEQCLADIALAIAQQPNHLSCYQLTIEPNTLFHHQPPVTPNHESLWEMQCALQQQLKSAGYRQYEVSAYSQANHQCKHNINYWQFGDYLGIGAGAHGKLTDANYQVQRYWKIKHPTGYLNHASELSTITKLTGKISTVATTDIPFEFMMNALRLVQGIDLTLFEQRTNLNIETIMPTIDQHIEQGLISINNNQLTPTDKGKLFIDSLLQDYLL